MEMEGRSAQGGEGRIDIWLRKHRLEYVGATRHHFIKSIRDGTIDFSSVKRWLGQDYLFVRALVPFVASVLIKACKESGEEFDMEVILSGMASLNDEIGWFKKEAPKWDVQLINVISQKANQNYCSFLESLMLPNVEYPVAITAFWAIEAVYQESFAHCLEEDASTRPELKVICERWGNDGFGQYCQFLKMIANRCLGKATDDVCKKAEVALLTVLDNEVRFWNMSNRES